jgi:hypothetical protein
MCELWEESPPPDGGASIAQLACPFLLFGDPADFARIVLDGDAAYRQFFKLQFSSGVQAALLIMAVPWACLDANRAVGEGGVDPAGHEIGDEEGVASESTDSDVREGGDDGEGQGAPWDAEPIQPFEFYPVCEVGAEAEGEAEGDAGGDAGGEESGPRVIDPSLPDFEW